MRAHAHVLHGTRLCRDGQNGERSGYLVRRGEVDVNMLSEEWAGWSPHAKRAGASGASHSRAGGDQSSPGTSPCRALTFGRGGAQTDLDATVLRPSLRGL